MSHRGATWQRLRAVKRRHDPTNLFRFNQNIPPAVKGTGSNGSSQTAPAQCGVTRSGDMGQQSFVSGAEGRVQYLYPDTLSNNPAFTNVIVVTGPVKTVYVGGQDAVDASGKIVGQGDLRAQTEQVLRNIQAALAAAGAGLEHVIKWNLYVVQGQPLQAGFEVFQQVWGNRPNPPAITMGYVTGLARPEFLLEMDAIAVVPL